MKRTTERFRRRLLQLEPVEILGIAKILGVSIFEETKPLPFEVVFNSILEKYEKLARHKRRNLDAVVAAATKKDD